jgi:hypothetical protein
MASSVPHNVIVVHTKFVFDMYTHYIVACENEAGLQSVLKHGAATRVHIQCTYVKFE